MGYLKAFDHHLFPLLDSSDDADGRRLLPRCLSLSLSLLSFVSCSLGVPGSGSSTVSSPKIKNSFQRPLFVLFRRFFIALLSAWRIGDAQHYYFFLSFFVAVCSRFDCEMERTHKGDVTLTATSTAAAE